jgi:hypothetical protein
LEGVPYLEEIYLGGNLITEITGLTSPNSLRVLKLENNKISQLVDISGLEKLEIFDLSNNALSEDVTIESFRSFLEFSLPQGLLQLYLSPNAFIGRIRNYRRLIVSTVEGLCFLDNSFVTPEEVQLAIPELRGDKVTVEKLRSKHIDLRKDAMTKIVSDFRLFQQENMIAPELVELKREILEFVRNC